MRWVSVPVVLALGLLGWGTWHLLAEPAVKQPIEFPHKTHLEFLECTDCHERATKGSAAGRPATENCLACHWGEKTESQELKKLQAFGKKSQEVPWKRVWHLPSHVFFSHRTHVVVAKVKCQTCHGPMETLERPPARPLKTLSMGDCIACHERWEKERAMPAAERRISTDCTTCHR